MKPLRKKWGALVCRLTRKHVHAICTYNNGYLFQLECPRCGAFVLLTQTDLERSIIEALEKEGKYTDMERIA